MYIKGIRDDAVCKRRRTKSIATLARVHKGARGSRSGSSRFCAVDVDGKPIAMNRDSTRLSTQPPPPRVVV